MNVAVAVTVFALVFPAELPDKTALASLILGSRYRPAFVFTGVAVAFAVHAALAVAVGSVLTLLPHWVLQGVVGGLFLLGAVLLLRGRCHEEEEHVEAGGRAGFWRVAATSFAVIIVAEFGDLTQIVTASLAARYHNPLAVGLGAALALWAVAALAIAGGRGLLKVIPLTWISRKPAWSCWSWPASAWPAPCVSKQPSPRAGGVGERAGRGQPGAVEAERPAGLGQSRRGRTTCRGPCAWKTQAP